MAETPTFCDQCGAAIVRSTSQLCSSCGAQLPTPLEHASVSLIPTPSDQRESLLQEWVDEEAVNAFGNTRTGDEVGPEELDAEDDAEGKSLDNPINSLGTVIALVGWIWAVVALYWLGTIWKNVRSGVLNHGILQQ